jgi:hypothetical protein
MLGLIVGAYSIPTPKLLQMFQNLMDGKPAKSSTFKKILIRIYTHFNVGPAIVISIESDSEDENDEDKEEEEEEKLVLTNWLNN